MASLGYQWRPDGMYLVRSGCLGCGEEFDCLAIAQARSECGACESARKQERRYLMWLYEVPTFWPYGEKNHG